MGTEIAPGKELSPASRMAGAYAFICDEARRYGVPPESYGGFWRRGGFGFPKTCGNVIFAIDKELGMVYTVIRLQDGS